MTNVPESDPLALWQSQTVDRDDVRLETLLEQAQGIAARVRRQVLPTLAAALVTTVLGVLRFRGGFPSTLSAVLWTAILILMWSWPIRKIWTAYRIHRWVWPDAGGAEVALTESIRFYRAQLERELARVEQGYRPRRVVGVALLLLASVAVLGFLRAGSFVNIMPVIVLVAAWTGLSFYARRHEVRRIRQELDDLDRFESREAQ